MNKCEKCGGQLVLNLLLSFTGKFDEVYECEDCDAQLITIHEADEAEGSGI